MALRDRVGRFAILAGGVRQPANLRLLGDRYRDERRWPEAARCYRQHLRDQAEDVAIWVQLGNCLKEAADYEGAREAYNRAILLEPGDADVFLQRGHLEKLMGRAEDAILSYRTSLELKPHDNEALRELLLLRAPDAATEALRAATGIRAEGEAGDTKQRHVGNEIGLRRRKKTTSKRPRILYISDSLGTPIHARGIYYYSVALAEMLTSLGLELTLVVERADGYGLDPRFFKGRSRTLAESFNSCFLAEIYRYFSSDIFAFNLRFKNEHIQWLFEVIPSVFRAILRVYYLFSKRRKVLVRNEPGAVDFRPSSCGHLDRFGRFLFVTKIYSDSLSRAVTGLGPVTISAAGYDAVIIDTPHFVRVKRARRSRVFTVVHDLIPLRDPFMWAEWRTVYLAKLQETLAAKGNLIFVSEYTRSLFYSELPHYRPNRDIVIYPTIRRDQATAAAAEGPAGRSYLRRIAADRAVERTRQLAQRANRLADDPRTQAALLKGFEETIAPWDPTLPYFTTVVSDEPRKNIKVFCEVTSYFNGRCNFIVIGQVDGNSYMKHEPELFPNLHFTGYVDDRDKAEILQHAAGVIFPSFSEGFGIPIVEGALYGVPVLCSNIEVFREIAGDLASYFDPYSADELVFRIEQVLQNPIGYGETAGKLREAVSKRFSQVEMLARLRGILNEVGVLK